MPLQSMTGFARSQGEFNNLSWAWEMRSVNGKGLDIRLRLPSGFDALEIKARQIISSLFKRGNIQVNLQLNQHLEQTVPTLNEAALDAVLSLAKSLQLKVGGDLPNAADLLAMRNIVEFNEPSLTDNERNARDEKILESLSQVATSLESMRVSEGQAIASVLESQIDKISGFHKSIENNEARTPEVIAGQLGEQVRKLIKASDVFDVERLHQEAVLLAAKADLQEELDRLVVHVNAAKALLKGDGPIGRKLDFLAQEFNRECNTICSKSNSAEVTTLGLDMKLVIDQFREQVQNME